MSSFANCGNCDFNIYVSEFSQNNFDNLQPILDLNYISNQKDSDDSFVNALTSYVQTGIIFLQDVLLVTI